MAAADGAANSISVTVRVRPFTIREAAQLTKCDDGPMFLGDGSLAGVPTPKLTQKGIRPVIKVVDDHCLVFDPPEDNPVQRFSKSVVGPSGKRVKDQTFAFDKVFDENTTQADVYESTTKNLLDSVLDGYNATVFAYGATGCGKTHTITGTLQQPGIIFLTMQELFERVTELQSEKSTEISLSYLEIYNETIRDLLEPGGPKGGLMLREDANQAVSVSGLSTHHPQNVQEVMDMIIRGNELRTMSPTEANATSSRSHAVLQINVAQKDRNAAINEPHTMATLSIIDLAGSERASATKNRGERLIEGANINRSLLALGSCINALCDQRKHNHVPYRNSKLTRLLKFSLGGNCKTVMIVCVSPSSAHFDETQNTLRYANRAKNIQTKVTRNVYNVNRHVKDYLKKIDEQMALINELKQQQKDLENVAMVKFRRQSEKREAIAREGVSRLRLAYDHSSTDRQDRINAMRRSRQIERRLAMINAWVVAFDTACEKDDEAEPQPELVAMRKDAIGTIAELEESRQHCHRRLTKNNWQRTIDSALQTGLKQLQDVEDQPNSPEAASLAREAEKLRADFERSCQDAVSQDDKHGDAALVQNQLQQLLQTAATITRLLSMEEQDAAQAARTLLPQLLKDCINVTSHAIRQDGSLSITEAFPPTRMGTPKRKKRISLMGPSPARLVLAPTTSARLSISPVKPSSPTPRRVKLLGSARKRSPKKKLVQWRDESEEDGQLADFSRTPVKFESTPESVGAERTEIPSIPEEENDNSEDFSSPIGPPPQTSFEVKPGGGRFQTGFLSKKQDSPAPPTLSYFPSSPEASPLQELSGNAASGRSSSGQLMPPPKSFSSLVDVTSAISEDESHHLSHSTASASASDSEKEQGNWVLDNDSAKEISKVRKRDSVSRSRSIRDSAARPFMHRRRSPSMIGASVLSPRTVPAGKGPAAIPFSGPRRGTMTTGVEDKSNAAVPGSVQRPQARVASGGNRLSVIPAGVAVGASAGKGSTGSGGRIAWRFV